jgi:hypothetical protein
MKVLWKQKRFFWRCEKDRKKGEIKEASYSAHSPNAPSHLDHGTTTTTALFNSPESMRLNHGTRDASLGLVFRYGCINHRVIGEGKRIK